MQFSPPRQGRVVFVFLCVCVWREVSSCLNDTLLALTQNSPSAQSSGEESTQSSKLEPPKCRLLVWQSFGQKRQKMQKSVTILSVFLTVAVSGGHPFTVSRLLRSSPTFNTRFGSLGSKIPEESPTF